MVKWTVVKVLSPPWKSTLLNLSMNPVCADQGRRRVLPCARARSSLAFVRRLIAWSSASPTQAITYQRLGAPVWRKEVVDPSGF